MRVVGARSGCVWKYSKSIAKAYLCQALARASNEVVARRHNPAHLAKLVVPYAILQLAHLEAGAYELSADRNEGEM